MPKPETFYHNLIGKRYNRLTILKIKREYGKVTMTVCRCDCGNIKEVSLHKVVSGTTKSCGCLKKELDTLRKTGRKDAEISETLCWKCSRSGKDCSWMKNFTPVKGWKAERYDYVMSYNKKMKKAKRIGKFYCTVDSYIVKECPLFCEKKKREENLPS